MRSWRSDVTRAELKWVKQGLNLVRVEDALVQVAIYAGAPRQEAQRKIDAILLDLEMRGTWR